jgi:hypothetical protein
MVSYVSAHSIVIRTIRIRFSKTETTLGKEDNLVSYKVNMHFSDILYALRNATPTGRRPAIVFRHLDIELCLLAEKVRDREIDWTIGWKALDESMPYDLPRPRSSLDTITVSSLFDLVVKWVPRSERNSVLARLSGKLAETMIAPWEVLDFIADLHTVEKESEDE